MSGISVASGFRLNGPDMVDLDMFAPTMASLIARPFHKEGLPIYVRELKDHVVWTGAEYEPLGGRIDFTTLQQSVHNLGQIIG